MLGDARLGDSYESHFAVKSEIHNFPPENKKVPLATTYFPTGSPRQYHRRWRA